MLCGAVIAVLLLMKYSPIKNSSIPRTAFCVGTIWIILFLCIFMSGTRAFVGIGFGSSVYVILAMLTVETCLLGILAFDSFWRLVALIPLLAGGPLILPWVVAWFISRP